jgi:glutathione S-transferase
LAILKLLGRLHGLYPDDIYEQWEVDSLLTYHKDLSGVFWDVLLNKGAAYEYFYKEYFETKLPKYFKILTSKLENNKKSKYLVGKKLTIADIDATGYAFSYIDNSANFLHEDSMKVLKEYPKVEKYY